MSFISQEYLLFFAVIFAAYWGVSHQLFRQCLLLAASYLFYSWIHPWMGALLASCTLINYLIGFKLTKKNPMARSFYLGALVLNFGGLIFFKYYSYLQDSFLSFADSLGISVQPAGLNALFPLGISFFTLQLVSYLTDVYQGTLKHESNLFNFALFVAFFPKLVAGPIERGKDLLPQIISSTKWSWTRFNSGWSLIILGYLNKIMIADNVAFLVDKVFVLQKPTLLMLGAGSLAFTLQIYADFTAYTHLARGFGKLLGFDLTENFNSPYLSLTPADFWRRWHISFSNWLRDYIFYPVRRWVLNAKLPGASAVFLPSMAAMLFSGAWHGVGWTFVAWGAYFGLLLSVYQLLNIDAKLKNSSRWIKLGAWVLNFGLIVFGWTLFRASSLEWLLNIFRDPVLGRNEESLITVTIILLLSGFYALPLVLKRMVNMLAPRYQITETFYSVFALILTWIFIGSTSQDFIYFNF